MGRLDRIKQALADTKAKLVSEIEEIHAKGHYPTDYSLGFANAMIFCDHHINMQGGQPKFYNRTTSIGHLPKPIALDRKDFVDMIKKENDKDAELAFLQDSALGQARGVIQCIHKMEHDSDPEIGKAFSMGLAGLKRTIEELDEFIATKDAEPETTDPKPVEPLSVDDGGDE